MTNINLNFELVNDSIEMTFISDITILRRILFNMIKNAAEAEKYKGDIYLGCKKTENDEILFYVKNKSYIEPETQTLIFQRNFSTKSVSRGLGTFSMKLLTENYLEGKVFFKSIKDEGTTFYLQIPLNRLKCEEYNE
jgi:signal transduction histidine kinase